MQPSHSNRASANGSKPLGLALGLPLLLLLAFFGAQFVNFDTVGWSSGFDHPWEGWDHLVTMLAVGIWAAQLRGRAIWMLPLAFVGVMGLGGIAGAEGFSIPHVEGIILLSCAVFGVLITRKVRFSTKVNVLIVAFFAFFHGFAHGHEISTSASLVSYVMGFMLATLLLHGAGILVAKLVVFTATCLLAALFSNAAIARHADNSVGLKAKSPPVSLVYNLGSGTGGALRNGPYSGSDADAIYASGGSQGRFLFLAAGGSGGDQVATIPPFSHSAHGPDGGWRLGIGPYSKGVVAAYPQWPLRQLPVRFDDDPALGNWRFKHYFPDINHTPGSDFLSNGVGLASPPLAFFAPVSPQDFPHFRNNSLRGFEKLPLQSSIARFDTGNPLTENSGNVRQANASFHRRRLKQATNFFPFAITSFRNHASEGSLLRRFFKNLAYRRVTAGRPVIHKNNNDITRRNNHESIL